MIPPPLPPPRRARSQYPPRRLHARVDRIAKTLLLLLIGATREAVAVISCHLISAHSKTWHD
jgi:hypothetical protein